MKKGKKKGLIIAGSVVLSLCLVYFLGGYVAALAVSDALFAKRQSNADEEGDGFAELTFFSRKDYPRLSSRLVVRFPSYGNELQGYFYPAEEAKGTFVFAHGLNGFADDSTSMLQDYLLGKGYSIFAFDMRSSGRSSGEGLTSLADGAYDVKSALDYLYSQNEFYAPMGEFFLCGYSWGAYSVGAALNFDYPSPIQGVLAFSGFLTPETEMRELSRNYIGFLADVNSLTLDWGLATKAGEDRHLSSAEGIAASSSRACLIQGDDDRIVPESASLYSGLEESDRVHKSLRQGFGHTRPWVKKECREFCENILEPLYRELGVDTYRAYLESNPSVKRKANEIDADLLDEALRFLET